VPDRPPGWLDAFDADARLAVAIAREAALGFGHNYLGSEHLLIGLIEVDGPARDALAGTLPSAEARLAVEQMIGRGQPPASDVWLSPRARLSMERAYDIASGIGSRTVEPLHLLIALTELGPDAIASRVLSAAGVDVERLRSRLRESLVGRRERETSEFTPGDH
jgi:ATP-dependent Clp protease ATP-binding subunit ClpC